MDPADLDLSLSDRGRALYGRLRAFLDEHVHPVGDELTAQMDALDGPEPFPPLMAQLRAMAREAGLWNLFLADPEHGAGLSNVDYGHLCELLGHHEWAPMVCNCQFPDTGNMEILLQHGDEAQRARWLAPLLGGETRSCFALTEPDVSSSDPTGIETRARRDGDGWVLDGRKWFISGAIGAEVCILMASTDPGGPRHERLTVFLVPMDAPGLEVVRRVPLFGHAGGPGHAELRLEGCRVGDDAVLGEVGQGFQIAQDRLGPGRIHHCMRQVGAAEHALALATDRAATRPHLDGVLADTQLVREHLAEARVELDAARLLVLRAARAIDLHGKRAAYRHISIAKLHTARMVQDVVDRAIQVHGALGMSDDTPLARMWVVARALRLGDGADEVHVLTIAKHELRDRERRLAEQGGAPAAA
ncbi:acyl-CoA dehydrogenase family protein [Conexibacter sp. SYSU D00693]|uniref:acyl-CoA dehydrogenase family protein n=1 Tax=Conexibacter sp. SYSU D00693 TaxID=2812560 RepID=UPI001F11EEE0|nr:acyl-CoA dehydrogenase family protein [Conexibacter sp. SYSU D00693]